MTDDPSDGSFEGFALPLPPRLLEALARSHDREHMAAHDAANRVTAALDSMSPEQLVVLRMILNSSGDRAPLNQFYDGMVHAILRLHHRVDPNTGRTPEEELLHAAASASEEPPEATGPTGPTGDGDEPGGGA